MLYSDFDKLKTFFLALNRSGFHPERMDPKIITPQDKKYCLNLLREKIPELKGKTDNELSEFLRDPEKVKRQILGKFVPQEEAELEKILDEKPVAEEQATAQPAEADTTTGQEVPQQTSGTGGGLPFGMPSGGASYTPPPRHIIYQTPAGGMEGGTGQGTAATTKIDRLTSDIPAAAAPTRSTETKQEETTSSPSPSRVNFSSFKSSLSSGFNKVKSFVSRANPFIKTNLGRIANGLKGMLGGLGGGAAQTGSRALGGLTNFANSRGIGGTGSRSIFGKISRFGRGGSGSVKSVAGNVKKRSGLKFAFGIILFMVLVGTIATISQPPQTGQASPISGGGAYTGADIASCTFYRGSDSTPGLKFNTPQWPALINDVASKVGVPAAVLAGILRVECPNCFASSDLTYITNDYDAHCSKDDDDNCIAYGAMQFTPTAFQNTFTNNAAEIASKFGKTSVSLDIKPQDNIENTSVLRLYSVKDSVIAAAFKVRADAGTNPPYNKTTIDKVVNNYYGCTRYDVPHNPGSCVNGAYSYTEDLWQSYNGCQATIASQPGNPSGPIIPNGEKGARIASAATLISNQLLHSINDAQQLTSMGIKCDPGTPSGGSNYHYDGYHCWVEMTNPTYDFAQDPDYLQCTEFVVAAFDKAGYLNQIQKISSTGNAVNWANNARSVKDYSVFNDARNLTPGDIISLGENNVAGHVVVVTQKEQNRIQIAQSGAYERTEVWYINTATGILNPAYPDYASRKMTNNGGFIRLNNFTK